MMERRMMPPPRGMDQEKCSRPSRTENRAPKRASVERNMAALVEVVRRWARVWMKKQRRVLKRPR